ncbi:MAG: hypothetical protein RL272_507 [Candidatus Parcubacteria bacterium]|jgi:S1-C subfamily serine protease
MSAFHNGPEKVCAGAPIFALFCAGCNPAITLLHAKPDAVPSRRDFDIRDTLVASTVFVAAEVTQPHERGWTSRTSSGTGVIISDDGPVVLTVFHGIRDAAVIRVSFLNADGYPSGNAAEMEAFRWSEEKDVALLRPADGRRHAVSMTIALENPRSGEPIMFLGRTSRFSAGRILDSEADLPPRGRTLEVEADSAQGDSGAPCVNGRGELVGILIAGSAANRRAYFVRIDDALSALGIR